MWLGWGADVLLRAGQEPFPRGIPAAPTPSPTPWLAQTVPRGPSDDKQVKNGGLAVSEPGVSSLS